MTIHGKSADTVAFLARRGCARKWRYPTSGMAKDAVKRVWAQSRWRMQSYECEFCGGYHLARRK